VSVEFHGAVFEEAGRPLQVDTLQLDEPGPREVLVRLAVSGVCHSDYHVLNGEWGARTPLVLGHEGAGVVAAIGSDVRNVAVGDSVVLSWTPACERCRYCAAGQPYLCTGARETAYANVLLDGTTRLRRGAESVFSYLAVGSFAEYAIVPESGAIRVPDDVPADVAALVGCAVTTGIGAVLNTAQVEAGATVLVVGCGGVGLSAVMGAKLASAARIVAVDVVPEKLALAASVGATETIDARTAGVVNAVRELTDGDGVDYAFEAIGRAETIEQCYLSLASGGTAVVVGQVPERTTITIDPMPMSGRELTLTGSNYGSARPAIDFPRILDFHRRGAIDLNALISRRIRLDEINEAFDDMRDGRSTRTVIEFA
jgi:S-(hydroxymethyl)glutathione dehydrogenase/alcohol dehydrogenase